MLMLVTGGSASGKSAFAESLLQNSVCPRHIYLAAMQPWDEECHARIARHRRQREGKGFETAERFRDLAGWDCPAGAAVLLECLSNLTANELFSQDPPEDPFAFLSAGLLSLQKRAGDLIVVTNEIFSDGIAYDAQTMRYLSLLGRLNNWLGTRADLLAEVVCGIPLFHKGAPSLRA